MTRKFSIYTGGLLIDWPSIDLTDVYWYDAADNHNFKMCHQHIPDTVETQHHGCSEPVRRPCVGLAGPPAWHSFISADWQCFVQEQRLRRILGDFTLIRLVRGEQGQIGWPPPLRWQCVAAQSQKSISNWTLQQQSMRPENPVTTQI